ncbi:hypothetical protein ABT215_43205 [Streptomyces sp900105755]|uniref:hypothetical protein n=1 Tax=Streptomyces sp. 900105755 TaxID=3154389 RepID=UPI0033223A25
MQRIAWLTKTEPMMNNSGSDSVLHVRAIWTVESGGEFFLTAGEFRLLFRPVRKRPHGRQDAAALPGMNLLLQITTHMDGDLQVPDGFGGVFKLAVGQAWPRGSETGLRVEYTKAMIIYQVVVSAPVEHAYAVASSSLEKGAHGALIPSSLSDAYGERRLSRWVGVIPGKAAYELGVLQDGYGAVPRYDELVRTEFPWLRQVQFGDWPANSLNPAAVLSRLEEVLRPLGLQDNDFEQVRQRVWCPGG